MKREILEKYFEKMGARITIRKGTSRIGGVVRLNVAVDKMGEHFTLTIHPDIDDSEIDIQVLDYDSDIKQMLLFVRSPRMNTVWKEATGEVDLMPRRSVFERAKTKGQDDFVTERLLVGRDEMHWFVAGVTASKTIREAFANLRPNVVTVAMKNNGAKTKDWRKTHKNKGFLRQGEWFFVPVDFKESSKTIILKNEPITRPGGKPHFVEEIVRSGGSIVYVSGGVVISEEEFKKLGSKERQFYTQRVRGARVLGRGKVKHPDHHTIELKSWHEIHLSSETGNTSNAFID